MLEAGSTRLAASLTPLVRYGVFSQIRRLLDWVDALPTGRQAVVTTLIASIAFAVVGTIWVALIKFVKVVRAAIARKRQAASANRQRLTPQPKVGLIEAAAIERDGL